MIYASIKEIGCYAGSFSARLNKALNWLKDADGLLAKQSEGRYEHFDGSFFYVVDRYETKEDNVFEAHRKHIDVHVLLEGKELVEAAPLEAMREKKSYDAQKDVCELEGEALLKLVLSPGFFAVFFPRDAHKPGLSLGNCPQTVKKCVFKVPLY